MPDQESSSPLPLEGADERSEAGVASPHVKIPLREPTSAPSGHLLPEEGECRLPYSKAFFPASSFRAKARNLFRLRSGETVREAGNGKRASCDLGSTVFHADGFTKENGNGKRKRSLGCARDDETGSGWFLTRFQIAAIHPLPSACPSSTSSQRGEMPEGLRRAFFSYRQHYPSG